MDKKINIILLCAMVISLMVPVALAKPKDDVTRIQDGILSYSAGHYLEGIPLVLGFDEYGYNYQGHMFKGSYFNAYAGVAGFAGYDGDDEAYLAANPGAENHWAWPYRSVQLTMKWSDAWLANTDADGDGALDRYFGYDSYLGSGAWLTNHMRGVNDDGTRWTYFTKIVAAPIDAYLDGGFWFSADGVEIGAEIWGAFATIQTVETDPMYGTHGLQYVSPYSAGFGVYQP
ncbi:MAG: hypothetical protein QCH99_08360 [Candidatus Bathyarchaeota archaeon]|nr:hypothetical protein [Candidatus Bathyarchaeum tardum]